MRIGMEHQRGDRVRLEWVNDPDARVKPGTEGTVTSVDDLGTVHVRWDSGGHLGLIPEVDQWAFLDQRL